MEAAPSWIDTLLSAAGVLSALATAVATVFLWRVTKTLAVETRRMAEAAAQPHVVATLEPNRWSINHFDLHVDNTGNATAYGIKVAFDPPLSNGEARGAAVPIPFQEISVLKPGQGLCSHLAEYAHLQGQEYRVQITWKRNATAKEPEGNAYTLRMSDHEGVSQLGSDPLVSIARHIQKIAESWTSVARGQQRTKVDIYSGADRLHEERRRRRLLRQVRARRSGVDEAQ